MSLVVCLAIVHEKVLLSSTVSFKNAQWCGEGVIVMVQKGVLRTTPLPFHLPVSLPQSIWSCFWFYPI